MSEAVTSAGEEEKDKSSKDKEKDKGKEKDGAKKPPPVISKSAILRLLAEIIKSYNSCTLLITQHSFEAGQSELVGEVSD